MLLIDNGAAFDRALHTDLDPALIALLHQRRSQLAPYADDIGELAHLIIIQPGDDPGRIDPPPLVNLVDGRCFGDPSFEPSWEHIQHHGGWFELTYVLTDDGFGHIVFVQDAECVDSDLLSLCRTYAPLSMEGD